MTGASPVYCRRDVRSDSVLKSGIARYVCPVSRYPGPCENGSESSPNVHAAEGGTDHQGRNGESFGIRGMVVVLEGKMNVPSLKSETRIGIARRRVGGPPVNQQKDDK
jgi:hypothetical protein